MLVHAVQICNMKLGDIVTVLAGGRIVCVPTIGIAMIYIGVVSATEITDIRIKPGISNTNPFVGLLELKYNSIWFLICHHGDPNTWGKREAMVACRHLGLEGGWPVDPEVNGNGSSTEYLYNFDCDGSETTLNSCPFDITNNCLESKLAGVQCYESFNVQLNGNNIPNVGNVEVKYDNVSANVCYESLDNGQWSFNNALVLCRELKFPGTMFSRRGSQVQQTGGFVLGGYKCKEDSKETSLKDCLPDPLIQLEDFNSGSCNAVVAGCAGPGYVGCFESNGEQAISSLNSTKMTINMCRKHCREQNYTYAYLSNGDTCFCENTTGSVPAGDIRCRSECTGDINQVCGDKGVSSVYDVTRGLCDDPFNDTGIYYYGDTFDGFECTNGEQSVRCVMGDSPEEMKWSGPFPNCSTTDENPSTTSRPSKGKKLDNGTVIIACVAAGIVIVLIILIAFSIRKRNKRPKSSQTKTDNEGQSEPLNQQEKQEEITKPGHDVQGTNIEMRPGTSNEDGHGQTPPNQNKDESKTPEPFYQPFLDFLKQ